MDEAIYFQLYSMLQQYIYGLDVQLTEHMDLVLTLLATIGSLAVVLLPFVVVFFGIFMLFNLFFVGAK